MAICADKCGVIGLVIMQENENKRLMQEIDSQRRHRTALLKAKEKVVCAIVWKGHLKAYLFCGSTCLKTLGMIAYDVG